MLTLQIQKIQERRELNRMVQRKTLGRRKESTRRSSRAKETGRSTKTSKLEELKKKREEKRGGQRSRKRASDDDDDYDEDGAYRRRVRSQSYSEGESDVEDRKKPEFASLEEIQSIQLTRKQLAEWCFSPFFENTVKGCFARVCIGADSTNKKIQVYRLCEIREVDPEVTSRPYECEGTTTNRRLKLKHGEAVRSFRMDLMSNSLVTSDEYNRWMRTTQEEKQKIISKREVDRKLADLQRARDYRLTEADVSDMIKQKQKLKNTGNVAMRRTELIGHIRVAEDAGDISKVAQLKQELAALENQIASTRVQNERLDALAKVNERNRQRDIEDARRIEQRRAEEKRRVDAIRASGSNTPTAGPLKTSPLFDSPMPGTSTANSGTGTPNGGVSSNGVSLDAAAKQAMRNNPLSRFEEAVRRQNIDVDLGDF